MTPPVSLPARIAGVIRRPRITFEALRLVPRFADVLLLTFLVNAALSTALLQTRVGRLALLDQWERTAVAFGQEISDEQYASMRAATSQSTAYALASTFAGGPLLTVSIAGLLYAGFRLSAGRKTTYRQVLAVVAHAGVILMLRQVVATPIVYARETLASPVTLSLFFTVLDEASPVARFLAAVDLFVVWWAIAIAIGMSVLYERPARRLALVFVAFYALLAVILTVTMALSGGTT
jgi:hypothetical protein